MWSGSAHPGPRPARWSTRCATTSESTWRRTPRHYEKLSERLKGILKDLEGRWEELVGGPEEAGRGGQAGPKEGRRHRARPRDPGPVLRPPQAGDRGDESWTRERLDKLCALTVELVDHIQQEISIVGFWRRAPAQEGLRRLDLSDPRRRRPAALRPHRPGGRQAHGAGQGQPSPPRELMDAPAMETLTVDELTFEVRRSPRRRTLEITLDRGGDLLIVRATRGRTRRG